MKTTFIVLFALIMITTSSKAGFDLYWAQDGHQFQICQELWLQFETAIDVDAPEPDIYAITEELQAEGCDHAALLDR